MAKSEFDIENSPLYKRTPYAEIAKLYDMSETSAQNVVKTALNKIFKHMISSHSDVFDVLKVMCEYLGMTEPELIRKLDSGNVGIVKQYASKHYNTKYYENAEREAKISRGEEITNDIIN